MIEPSLNQLEQEVRSARAKLATDLSTLRSPATAAEFTETLKLEAMDAKDALLDKAKTTVQSSLESFIEDLKARAAANPAAALAIAGGIAWRLIRHPPIATVLIGAGLLSLFRTSPRRTNGYGTPDYFAQAKSRLMEQASEAAEVASGQAAAMAEAATAKAAETAGKIKERAQDLAAQASSAASNITEEKRQQAAAMMSDTKDALAQRAQSARSAAAAAASRATEALTSAGNIAQEKRQQGTAMLSDTKEVLAQRTQSARTAAASAASRATEALDQGWQRTQSALSEAEARDKVILAAAGIAVAAALGFAWQRRTAERTEA